MGWRWTNWETIDELRAENNRLRALVAVLEVRCDQLKDEIWECLEANDR